MLWLLRALGTGWNQNLHFPCPNNTSNFKFQHPSSAVWAHVCNVVTLKAVMSPRFIFLTSSPTIMVWCSQSCHTCSILLSHFVFPVHQLDPSLESCAFYATFSLQFKKLLVHRSCKRHFSTQSMVIAVSCSTADSQRLLCPNHWCFTP